MFVFEGSDVSRALRGPINAETLFGWTRLGGKSPIHPWAIVAYFVLAGLIIG